MVSKILILCSSALLIQTISGQIINSGSSCNGGGLQYTNNGLGLGLSGSGFGSGLGSNGNLANSLTSGGGFIVTSSSPIAPTGISVLADNLLIEGPLTVGGSLPLLATVGLEGELATNGQASTTYSCGNGNIGITSQTSATSGQTNGASLGNSAALANFGAVGAGPINYAAIGAPGPANYNAVGAGSVNYGAIGGGSANYGAIGAGSPGIGYSGAGAANCGNNRPY